MGVIRRVWQTPGWQKRTTKLVSRTKGRDCHFVLVWSGDCENLSIFKRSESIIFLKRPAEDFIYTSQRGKARLINVEAPVHILYGERVELPCLSS